MLMTTIMAAGATAAQPPNLFVQMLPFVFMIVIFYFLLIRPQQQARKRHMEMVSNVKRGDTVVTAGGIIAKVTKASEGDEITVEIADGINAQVVKSTITNVRSRTEPTDKK